MSLGTCKWAGGGGGALNDLTDVNLTSLIDEDILVFDAGTNKWINLAIHDFIGGLNFDFCLSDTADGVIGGYLRMFDSPTGEGESSVNALIVAADTAIEEWITASDQPTFTILAHGVYTFHFHAEKDGPGKKDVRVYAELYKRAVGGAETLLMTFEDSALLTTSSAQYEIHGTSVTEETIASDDRFVLKTLATPNGAGGDPTVTIAMEGTTASRLEVRSDPSALDERYLRLDGVNPMIGNLNMDSNNLVSVGNAGFGTPSPQKNIHIEDAVPTIRLSDSNAATDQAVATLIEFYRGNNTNRVGFLGMESSSNNNLRIATNYAAGQIQLGTGNSVTALTIDSSQRVGIGTIPKNWDPTTASVLQIFSGENALVGAGGSIQLCQNAYWDDVDNRWEYVIANEASRYNQADGGHFFESAIAGANPDDPITWLPVLTLDNSRNAEFAGNVKSTGGTAFDIDTAGASADANTLDGYEEGTWTPVLSDAAGGGNLATLFEVHGNYTRIGDVCYIRGFIGVTNTLGMTGGNDAWIQDLPFTGAAVTGNRTQPMLIFGQLLTFTNFITFNVSNNGSFGRIGETGSGQVGDFLIVSQIANFAFFSFSGFYKVQ